MKKIAVTYENGQVFQHFGHTSEFKIYDVEDNKVVSSAVVSTDGFGHESLRTPSILSRSAFVLCTEKVLFPVISENV